MSNLTFHKNKKLKSEFDDLFLFCALILKDLHWREKRVLQSGQLKIVKMIKFDISINREKFLAEF